MKVKDLLTSEAKWIKGSLAKTIDDLDCEPNDPAADKFCLVGAIRRCYPMDSMQGIDVYAQTMTKTTHYVRSNSAFLAVAAFNDNVEFNQIEKLITNLDL